MGNLQDRLEAFDLPIAPVQARTTLYRTKAGTYHFPHRWRKTDTACGRKHDTFASVECSPLDEPKVCGSCVKKHGRYGMAPWPVDEVGTWMGHYLVLLALDDEVTALARQADAGELTTATRQRLANLADLDTAPDVELKKLWSYNFQTHPERDAPLLYAIRVVGQRARTVLNAVTDTRSVVEEACWRAAIDIAQYRAGETGDGGHGFPSFPTWLGVTRQDIALQWARSTQDSSVFDFDGWLSQNEAQARGSNAYRYGRPHGPGMIALERIPYDDCRLDPKAFSSPMEWAWAEYRNAWQTAVHGTVKVLDRVTAELKEQRDEVVLFMIGPRANLTDPTSAYARAIGAGRIIADHDDGPISCFAVACPFVAAEAVAQYGRGTWIVSREGLDDDVVTTAVNLYQRSTTTATSQGIDDLILLARAVLA